MTDEVKAPLKKRRRRSRKIISVEQARQSLSKVLPSSIHQVLLCYEDYSRSEIPEDSKGFAAHHAACKAALSHLELLTKLVRWAEQPEEQETVVRDEDEEIASLLENARAALQEIEV